MLKKLINFFRRLFGEKPKEDFQVKVDKALDEVLQHPEKTLINVKQKIHTFAFRKQQLIGKAFFKENKLFRIEKFLGMNKKFKYHVSHKKLS